MEREVVVTGVGILSALGTDVRDTLHAVMDRAPFERCARVMEAVPDLPGPTVLAARVAGPDPASIRAIGRPLPDRLTSMAIIAADRALDDANAAAAGPLPPPERRGSILNTTLGPNETVEQYLRTLLIDGPARVSPITFSRTVTNAAAGLLAARHRLLGASTVFMGASAVGQGYRWIRRGTVDWALCVGVDVLRPVHAWTHQQLGRISAGLRLGEASAAVVLEAADTALDRSARIYAKVAGHGAQFCRTSVVDFSAVDPPVLKAAMRQALSHGRGESRGFGCVSLTNGLPQLDEAERVACADVMPSGTEFLSPKLSFGETFGASGEVGVAMGAMWLWEHGRDAACLVNACQIGGAVWSTLLERSTA